MQKNFADFIYWIILQLHAIIVSSYNSYRPIPTLLLIMLIKDTKLNNLHGEYHNILLVLQVQLISVYDHVCNNCFMQVWQCVCWYRLIAHAGVQHWKIGSAWGQGLIIIVILCMQVTCCKQFLKLEYTLRLQWYTPRVYKTVISLHFFGPAPSDRSSLHDNPICFCFSIAI